MNSWVPAVTLLGVAIVIGTAVVLRGPVGKALAAWIRGWSATDSQWIGARAAVQAAKAGIDPQAGQLAAQVDELSHRLAEVEERLDFTERMLAQSKEKAIPPQAGRA